MGQDKVQALYLIIVVIEQPLILLCQRRAHLLLFMKTPGKLKFLPCQLVYVLMKHLKLLALRLTCAQLEMP